MIPLELDFSSGEQRVSGGICILFAKRTNSNLPFGAMMSPMALHSIVMKYKDTDARGRTDSQTQTDTHGRCGRQWEDVEGSRGWDVMHGATLQRHGVVCCVICCRLVACPSPYLLTRA